VVFRLSLKDGILIKSDEFKDGKTYYKTREYFADSANVRLEMDEDFDLMMR